MSSFFFIDDSGSKQWDTPYSPDFTASPPARTDQNRTFWQNNYFVLAGIYIDRELIKQLNPLINEKKIEVFGTKHVEIRSVQLRNPEKRRVHYLEPFGITEDRLREFIEEFWYKLFEDNKNTLQIQAIVLDKRYYKNKRIDNMPLDLATQALLDRVEWHPMHDSTIVFDQMDSQITSTRGDQGKIIHLADRSVNLGSFHNKYTHTAVRFEESKNSNFLQLADTAAYNTLRQFIEHGDKWDVLDGQKGPLPMYPYFERISDNFYCNPKTQVVKGYGLTKLPDPNGKSWKKTNKKPPTE